MTGASCMHSDIVVRPYETPLKMNQVVYDSRYKKWSFPVFEEITIQGEFDGAAVFIQ